MAFSIFKKTDPVCGMKQEKEKGFIDKETNHWFCSQQCKQEFYKKRKKRTQRSCCGN